MFVIVARLGGFLRVGLGRLGGFLRVRVGSAGSAVLVILLQRVEEDLEVFDLLLPLFRSALQNVAVGELGCRVGEVADVEGADVQLCRRRTACATRTGSGGGSARRCHPSPKA